MCGTCHLYDAAYLPVGKQSSTKIESRLFNSSFVDFLLHFWQKLVNFLRGTVKTKPACVEYAAVL
jgi:hypothetical protein